MKYFPDFQQNFAPMAEKLTNLELPGIDTAQSVQESIAEILKGDASDATNRLGGEQCPLYENLLWVRKVKTAFDNGIDSIIRRVNSYLAGIPNLPKSGIPGNLISDTEALREELQQMKTGLDFHARIPGFQTTIAALEQEIQKGAEALIEEEKNWLEKEKYRLMKMADWEKLGEEDRGRVADRLDELNINAPADLKGIQKIISDRYSLTQEIKDIEEEIHLLAWKDEGQGNGGDSQELLIDFRELPVVISEPDEIDRIISELEALKVKLGAYTTLKINWKLQMQAPE